MKLEDQVCSFELAEHLNNLGVKQSSYFYWITINYNPKVVQMDESTRNSLGEKCRSAFTVAELGEILPNCVQVKGHEPFDNYRIVINKFYSGDDNKIPENNYRISYECDTMPAIGDHIRPILCKSIYDPNLANAMAKMLIYLLENKLCETAV